jgi:hypothetical protein
MHRDEVLSKRRNVNSTISTKVVPIGSNDEQLNKHIKEYLVIYVVAWRRSCQSTTCMILYINLREATFTICTMA